MRRGSASIAANPVLIGAATTLVVLVAVFLAYNANSGLPFVPTYQLKAEVPNAANLVVGNDVRIGGTRVGTVDDDHAGRPQGRLGRRAARPQARDDDQAAARRLDRDRPPAVRARAEVRADHAGAQRARVRGRRDHPASARRRRRRSSSTRSSTRSTTARARPRAQHRRVRHGVRRPRGRPQPRDRGLRPAAAEPRAGHAEPVGPADAAARLLPGARADAARDRRAGGRDPGLPRSQPRHDVRRARHRRAPLQESIRGGPPRSTPATRALPQPGRSWPNTEGAVPRAAAGRARAADRRADLADALEIGTPALKRSEQFNARLVPTFQSLERFADDPLVALGVSDLTTTAQILNPTIATLTPAQTVCNYITLWFRNVGEPAQRGRHERHHAALHHPSPRRRARTTRAARPRRRRTARTGTTTCTRTRTRTPPRPASRGSARRATRSTWPADRSSATCRATRARSTTARRGARRS